MKKLIAVLLVCVFMLTAICASAEGEWRNILLLGNDTRNFPQFERSDTMIIISANEAQGRVKLTSIMRDTDVDFAGGGSGKINGAMATGGPEKAVATVNQNFGMDITEYIVVDFMQLVDAVNLIGGVDIELTAGEAGFINTFYEKFGETPNSPTLHEGLQKLEGWQALNYSRDRSSSPAGDFDRVTRQRKMLIALLRELQEKPIDAVLELADDLMALVSTNMSSEQLLELGKFALTLDADSIRELRLPAEGTYQSGTFGGVWKIKPNLEKNTKILRDFIIGVELQVGSQGEEVRELQQKLVEMGLLNGSADGVYGEKTAAAVSAAQAQLGMEETGKAGEAFLDALYAR